MNKKLIASGMALALCLAAVAPVYKSLSFKSEILEPAKLQEVGTQADWDLVISESATMKAENFAINSAYQAAAKAASTNTGSANSTPAVEKSTVQSKSVKSASTVKKTTSTSTKKKAASTSRTTVSRGTTSTSNKTASATAARTTSKPSVKTVSSATSSKASAVIATAKRYIGVPYVWGGESPSGFDCSGFTQYVLSKNGISIPRVTTDQYRTGTAVSRSNLKVGDLVFFTTYKPGPSHVGFYMGDGKFIHASSSKGVTISSLDSSYYSGRYIGAKRVF